MQLKKSLGLKGELTIPGDKSISHRAIMLGSIAKGTTTVTHFLQGADCLSTISCFRKMGISIREEDRQIIIQGKGLHGLTAPDGILDVGNSGTTARLLSGILAAQPFSSTLDGDASLRRRPMGRVMSPLSLMGAGFTSLKEQERLPFQIQGGSLHGITYETPIASAQVKSAILLAGLYADSDTTVVEPSISRDHTELMLRYFGQPIQRNGSAVTLSPVGSLLGGPVRVPGDISSAAYFIAAGLLVPNSEIYLRGVGVNPTRSGMLRVCREMGGTIRLENQREEGGEPVSDLILSSSSLHGVTIEGDLIPTLIDELPVLAVLACFADGVTVIRDARELRVKESDRIAVMTENLTAMGADVTATEDGMIIRGGKPLHGAVIQCHADHRIAMSFAIAALGAEGITDIPEADCVSISYPSFFADLNQLCGASA